ncbi:MAG TPA: CRTAC1 family protein [Thermoanaerobaculia bacterium]|nr:CRTAC1 family protein [Thermoanaerobaculia bacterium]
MRASAVLLTLALLAGPAPAAEELFADRAAAWGLAFTYRNGSTGQLYYPEIIGGGAALFDMDNDGDLDAFLPQGATLAPGKTPAPAGSPPGGRLFRNDLTAGVPRFVDVTEASGLRALGYGTGAAAADQDNDGDVDLYILGFGDNQLWRNRGDGTFEEVTRAAQAASAGAPRFSLSASFADLDRDGDLDLFVTHYVEFSVEHNPVCYGPSSRRDYCGPTAFPEAPGRLLRNRGDGTFEDVSAVSGIAAKAGRGMGVVAVDLDRDGWQDLFVANDGMFNFLWRNLGGLRFEEVALPAGVAVNAEGRPEANMGIAAGDFDADGDDDLFVTHIVGETDTLWVNDGAGTFEDRTNAARLGAPGLAATGFGTGFLDYDNDGWLDLFAANGAVLAVEAQVRQGSPYPYAQTHQLFRNLGGGRFADVSAEAGAPFRVAEVGRGAAFGDIDNDGDTDVLLVNSEGPARLLVNQVGSRRPWLGLRLTGPPNAKAKRDLLGARVGVFRKGAPTLWRRAATDGSYASASDPRVLVGLGDAAELAEVIEVRVTWPDGKEESFPPPPLRAYTTLIQGTGKPSPGEKRP